MIQLLTLAAALVAAAPASDAEFKADQAEVRYHVVDEQISASDYRKFVRNPGAKVRAIAVQEYAPTTTPSLSVTLFTGEYAAIERDDELLFDWNSRKYTLTAKGDKGLLTITNAQIGSAALMVEVPVPLDGSTSMQAYRTINEAGKLEYHRVTTSAKVTDHSAAFRAEM